MAKKKTNGKKPARKTSVRAASTSPSPVRKKTVRAAPRKTAPGGDDIPFALPQVEPAAKRRAKRLLEALREEYPDAHCELDYTLPHELLVATILSAQTTDVAVNKATPALFDAFPMPADYAAATPEQIEPFVRTLGFFRNKAKAVHAAMAEVVENFGGEVPRTMEDLLTLRGVARKTANVVLGNAFDINVGFVVDTHIQRLSTRFGLVEEGATPQMIERQLMALFPRESWCELSHMLIWHGRRACKARGATCEDHPICKKYGIACTNRAG
jgi:endonuclease-3